MAFGYYSANGAYYIEMDVWLNSQDIANNTSNVGYYVRSTKVSGTGYFSAANGSNSWWGDVDGSIGSSSGFAYDFRGSTPNTLTWASGTKTISHADDGTKTVYFSSGSGLVNLGSAGASGSLALPRIPRGPRVKVAGTWRNSVAYVKVGGVWRIAIPYVKSGGTWRIGGS